MHIRTWVLGLALAIGASPANATGPGNAKAAKAKAKVELGPDLAALAGADVEAAAKAAEHLGTLDEPAAHDALLDALAFGLPAPVAVPAFAALGKHPAPPDAVALRRYAGHHNPNVRSAAVATLALYPSAGAKAAVVAALHDPVGNVRAAAAAAAAQGHVREATDTLFELMAKGEQPAARALATMGDADMARRLGDELGKVPDPMLTLALGLMLRRADIAEPVRIDIVHAIAKISDASAVTALSDYVDATPKNPPRQSRAEAEKVIEARLGGGAK